MLSKNTNEGVIVILNGPSSVGKTSIQKSFQKQSNELFLRIGIDTFFDELIEEPDLSNFANDKKFDQYTSQGEYIRGIDLIFDENGCPVVPLKIGSAGDRIMFGMHRAIAAYAKAGNNVIVDYIVYKPSLAKDLDESLSKCKTYFVGVHAPLIVIEEREKARKTSPCGHARSHYGSVHQDLSYDLEVDTSKFSASECADKILKLIEFGIKKE